MITALSLPSGMQKRAILRILFTAFLFTAGITNKCYSSVSLPALFQSHMVMQQNSQVAIWGWGTPGTTVMLTPGWHKPVRVRVGADGRWQTRLSTLRSGGVYSLQIADKDTVITLTDILFGEVWFCSGQSNMNFPLAKGTTWRSGVKDYEKVVAAADYPDIRYFDVERQTSAVVSADCRGHWEACTPQTAGSFSAVAYYFAVEIHKMLKVPVGIIQSSWGGTAIQSWMKQELFTTDKAFDSLLVQARQEKPNTTDTDSANINSRKISYLYNAMVAPLIPFTIKGMLWYQGENNAQAATLYQRLLPAFIQGLRKDWKADFPFYFVQLAPYKSSTPEIREAQLLTYQSVPNTGMAVIADAGDSSNIHPRNKEIVGKRLSLWALANTYHLPVSYSGPVYRSVSFEQGKAVITFSHADSLYAADGRLQEFTIAGADGQYYAASATIKDNKVVVWSEKVPAPAAVRYGWRPAPRAELFNNLHIPASSFRSDASAILFR